MSASGSLSVKDFQYLPAVNGRVANNQIRNTALGSVIIDKDVSVFVKDAVFAELRFVGLKLDNPQRPMSGVITEFLIDDLGYSVDWTLSIKYTITDASGHSIYEAEKVTKRNTAKFANAFGALNETIKLNVEELLKDPAFLKSVAL